MGYQETKAFINANIKQNGENEITGSILNTALNDVLDSGHEEVNQLGQEVTELTYGASVTPLTLSETTDYMINAEGAVRPINNFAYSEKYFVAAGTLITVKARGYDTNVAMISKVVTEGSSYIPVVMSVDSTVRVYTYFVEEDGYYASSWDYNYERVVSLATNTPEALSQRIDQPISNISDGAVTQPKLSQDVQAQLIKQVRSVNLYDERQRVDGYFVSNNGNINPASGWAVTPYIPVTAGNKYTISCKSSARGQGISWFSSNKTLVSGGGGNIYGTHTAPENAAYLVFNVGANNAYSTEVMVVEGEESVPFVPYKQIEINQVKGLDAALDAIKVGPLKITKNGNSIVIADGENYISAVLNKNAGDQFGGNPVFNFVGYKYNGQERTNNDDIAPLHAYNTTIGANHGQPCVKATIASHGLDNTAIGSGWSKDGVTYYVMRIVDADNVIFLSENRGSISSPSFVTLTTGTLTKGGDTLVVTAVASSQLYPALKNHSITLSLDGNKTIAIDGDYQCDYIDIVESYDIMNPVSTLSKIIARAGQSGDPVYDGDAGIHIENTYHITNNLAIVVISNLVPLETFAFSDAMFSQMLRIGNNGSCKYYVPNSLPLGNGGQYDMRKPLAMTWGSSVPTLKIGASQMADPQHPVNRIVQYDGSLGAALGFLTDRGVGSALLDFTNYVFELRNDTGKVYPHGVDTKVGSTLSSGQIFSAVLYRALFIPESVGSRLSMYHFDLAGAEYVYVDYKASMLDKVSVSNGLNGKKIEVLESSNCQLKSDVYNDGFYVDATYVNDETCYLIAKII